MVALLIRHRMGAPVLLCQLRPGRDGKPFRIVKFRTMHDALDAQGRALPDVERLTRLGRFLRATSRDKVPEHWNVLTGAMSLVGPRPLLMEYLPLYASGLPSCHANSAVHEKLAQQCADAGVGLFKVRAADIVVMDAVEIGKGAVLSPFVTLISNIRIGRCFHANIYSHVAHACVIGDFVTFAPGVKCNRNVVIADHVYVGVVRGQRRVNASVRRWRSRQRQSDRRDHRRRADPAHPCRGGGASGGLALRHGSDHGAGRSPRAEGDRGLRPGPWCALQGADGRRDRPCWRVVVLSGQDHDHRRRGRHGHHQ